MRTLLSPRRILTILAIAAGLAAPAMSSPVRAAAPGGKPTPVATATAASGCLGSQPAAVAQSPVMTQEQSLTATNGTTVVSVPLQVTSGKHLLVLVCTAPGARVTVTVGFPDGSSVVRTHRADADGHADFDPLISYQPQGSAESATITVTSMLPRAGLVDTVQGNVTVLPHIVLWGIVRVPTAIAVGRTLVVTVVSNHPGTQVRIVLIYPDRQAESGSGVTAVIPSNPGLGALTRGFLVSSSDGTNGFLDVQVSLSYQGVPRQYFRRVALRARKA